MRRNRRLTIGLALLVGTAQLVMSTAQANPYEDACLYSSSPGMESHEVGGYTVQYPTPMQDPGGAAWSCRKAAEWKAEEEAKRYDPYDYYTKACASAPAGSDVCRDLLGDGG